MTGFGARNRARLVGWIGCAVCCAAGLLAGAQVFTVGPDPAASRYADIRKTDVALPDKPLLQRTRQELIRVLDAEQGFAMRPLPKGSKGMVLHANGPASPSGSDYVKSLQKNGIAFQPSDRVAITDVKIFPDKIVLEFNGGPDHKHKFLRHVSIGAGGGEVPLARDDGQEPQGVRLTLQFEKFVPELTGDQVKELISPLVDFKLKTPVQAYVDTLPPKLKAAILNHHVLVGMNQEMVVHAVGHPDKKIRERTGDMPFEEWIYGEAPKDVEFVRFNGNRVIQVEKAKLGEPPVLRDQDEMDGYWSTVANPNLREVKLGDVNVGPDSQQRAAAAPPTLRKPGETLPTDQDGPNSMQRVQFPKGMDKASDKTAPIPQQPTQTVPAASGNGGVGAGGAGGGSGPQQNALPGR